MNRNSLDMDDGLNGVDDFNDEVNPFEASSMDFEIPSDTIANDSNEPPVAKTSSEPPAYVDVHNDISPSDENNGTLPPGLLNYCSRYFRLTDAELKQRVFNALKFTKDVQPVDTERNNSTSDDSGPDLFAAVWITAFLITIHFITRGFVSMLIDNIILGAHPTREVDRTKTFSGLVRAVWLFYGYNFLVPFVSFQILKRDESSRFKSSLELVSVYGYANVNWLPFIFIENILEEYKTNKMIVIAQWAVLAVGTIKSGLFLCKEVQGSILSKLSLATIIILILHAAFSVIMMWFLF